MIKYVHDLPCYICFWTNLQCMYGDPWVKKKAKYPPKKDKLPLIFEQ